MSNGKDEEDVDFTPNDTYHVHLSTFKIRYKDVLKSLKKLDPQKSANGSGPRFLKECAAMLAPACTRLFRMIIKRCSFVSKWKIHVQRVSPVHKRGKISLPKMYRPVSVVDNLSAVSEDVVKPQFEAWACKFIPDWRYGFIPEYGTVDYGAALTLKIQDCLERRGQGVLIATDIQGAFGRCWWARMKKRLKKKNLRRRALRLIKSYLFKRFLKVVVQGKEFSLKEIFSSVPQGGKWSSLIFFLILTFQNYQMT